MSAVAPPPRTIQLPDQEATPVRLAELRWRTFVFYFDLVRPTGTQRHHHAGPKLPTTGHVAAMRTRIRPAWPEDRCARAALTRGIRWAWPVAMRSITLRCSSRTTTAVAVAVLGRLYAGHIPRVGFQLRVDPACD
jgi:hypothetical protein